MARDASFFGLNRPEYVPSRELFMSELAWSLTEGGSPRRIDPNYGQAGIAYADRGAKRNSSIATTRPLPDDSRFREVLALLREKLGLRSDEDAGTATAILLEELEAPASAGATRSVATPLTIEAALLQDRRGVTGKNNPANIALILEQMYALGGGSSSVAGRWAGSIIDAGPAGLPGWVSEAIAGLLPREFQRSAGEVARSRDAARSPRPREPAWLSNYPETPFRWFAEAWDRLCTNGWIDNMPRRRWADWAACIARTGIASGYMFEMHLARRMLAALASDLAPDDAVRTAIEDSNRLIFWNDRNDRVAADVGPTMNQLAATGTECLSLLADLVEPDDAGVGIPAPIEYDDDPDGLVNWLGDARAVLGAQSVDVRERVSRALDADRSGSANNTWETIRYSLLDRSASGAGDLYALLRSAGRYTWVEPGQEWLVTIASLQAPGPGELCRLNDLQDALSSIGIEAFHQTLVNRLEGFGLARSSHDADDALEIMAGF